MILNEETFRIAKGCPIYSPYGKVQTGKEIAPGIFKVTCANHGGIYVPPESMERIPAPFRTDDGWYEEDEAVDIVYWFIPETATHNPRIDRETSKAALMKGWAKQWAEAGL